MTGLSPSSHGDRIFKQYEPMPDAITLAQSFRNGGYQANAVGKLHVHPQRDRIGFDDVILEEEGRHQFGGHADDYEMFLDEQGYGGRVFEAGHATGDYTARTWHLPEYCHPTNWATREMCRQICRRDPNKPAFWYLSYSGPHPPVWPLQTYLEKYRNVPIDRPVIGEWAKDDDKCPYALRCYSDGGDAMQLAEGVTDHEIEWARRCFYATLSHIDQQIAVVIGTLREEQQLDNTLIMFTSDHGDMLGDHHRWAKACMYDMSCGIPLLVVPPVSDERLSGGHTDNRLTSLEDIMPTLLDYAGLPIPEAIDGTSLLSSHRREHLYGEMWEGALSTRMVRTERHKLIYYPAGNRFQLFDLDSDPRECHDLSALPEMQEVVNSLVKLMIRELYGEDLNWVKGDTLIGMPEPTTTKKCIPGLGSQRGIQFR